MVKLGWGTRGNGHVRCPTCWRAPRDGLRLPWQVPIGPGTQTLSPYVVPFKVTFEADWAAAGPRSTRAESVSNSGTATPRPAHEIPCMIDRCLQCGETEAGHRAERRRELRNGSRLVYGWGLKRCRGRPCVVAFAKADGSAPMSYEMNLKSQPLPSPRARPLAAQPGPPFLHAWLRQLPPGYMHVDACRGHMCRPASGRIKARTRAAVATAAALEKGLPCSGGRVSKPHGRPGAGAALHNAWSCMDGGASCWALFNLQALQRRQWYGRHVHGASKQCDTHSSTPKRRAQTGTQRSGNCSRPGIRPLVATVHGSPSRRTARVQGMCVGTQRMAVRKRRECHILQGAAGRSTAQGGVQWIPGRVPDACLERDCGGKGSGGGWRCRM